MEVNRQENGYECGMHVLEIAYQLIETKFSSSGTLETFFGWLYPGHVRGQSTRRGIEAMSFQP